MTDASLARDAADPADAALADVPVATPVGVSVDVLGAAAGRDTTAAQESSGPESAVSKSVTPTTQLAGSAAILAGPRRRDAMWLPVLGVAVLAGLAYGWGIGHGMLHVYYAAAVRTMAHSWKAFFFGGFDPAGGFTIDKLPGAFWVQALLVRVFGLHTWVLIAPQVAAAIGIVLMMFVAVRRIGGSRAGLVAAIIAAATPALAVMSRGNTPDAICVFLMVVAADTAIRAIRNGRVRTLILAGVWVGLAFQAKMVEAWGVLPGIGLAYLIAAPGGLRRRLARLGAATAVMAVVSLSWMTVVSLVPAHDRPYVDGSAHDSVFEQVFDYNAVGRFGRTGVYGLADSAGYDVISDQTPAQREQADKLAGVTLASVDRLIGKQDGPDAGWFLPLAILAAVGLLIADRRRPRTDLRRAAVVVWGLWLAVFTVAFSASTELLSFYLGALVPPIAVLGALGAQAVLRRSRVAALAEMVPSEIAPPGTTPPGTVPAETMPAGSLPAETVPSGSLLAGTVPAGSLPAEAVPAGSLPAGAVPAGSLPAGAVLPGTVPAGSSARRVVMPVVAVCLVGALTALSLTPWNTPLGIAAMTLAWIAVLVSLAAFACRSARTRARALSGALAVLLLGPIAAVVAFTVKSGGAYDYALHRTYVTWQAQLRASGTSPEPNYGGVIEPQATDLFWMAIARLGLSPSDPQHRLLIVSSAEAANYVLGGAKGVEVVGGYTGLVPSPTVADLQRQLDAGQIAFAIVPPATDARAADPRVRLIESACHEVDDVRSALLYNCLAVGTN